MHRRLAQNTFNGHNTAYGEDDADFYECQGEDIGEEYVGRLGPDSF